MEYGVTAVPDDGYEFSHWQYCYRQSNQQNDIAVELIDDRVSLQADLRYIRDGLAVKAPLVYLVAHFRKVGPVLESPPTTFEPVEPQPINTPDLVIDEMGPDTMLNSIEREEILRALDNIQASVDKIRNKFE